MTVKPNDLGTDINSLDTGYREAVPHIVILRMSYMSIINYSYLVVDNGSNQSVIVDPAWNMEKIDQALAETRTSLRGILLTHSHPDHIHLAEPLAAKHHCPVWMSHEEIAFSGFSTPQLVGINMRPWLVGQMQIQPILTPGHTPGSTCYLIGNNLFAGDTLFAEGCGTCPDTQAAHAMFASLQHLKIRLRSDTRIFPGHIYGNPPGQNFSLLLKDNIYLQFRNENDLASYRLRKGQNKLNFFNFQ